MTAPRIVTTGIYRGIGLALALQLAAEGARVCGIHRSSDPAVTDEFFSAIHAAGGEAIIYVCDMRSAGAIDNLADEIATTWGVIDGSVNNAARLLMTTSETFSRYERHRLGRPS